MANIQKNAASILAGNLNSGYSYLITAVPKDLKSLSCLDMTCPLAEDTGSSPMAKLKLTSCLANAALISSLFSRIPIKLKTDGTWSWAIDFASSISLDVTFKQSCLEIFFMGVLKLTKGGWIGYLQPSGNLELEKKSLNKLNLMLKQSFEK